MPIPAQKVNTLRIGQPLAAPIALRSRDRCAFIAIFPQCPSRESPDAWIQLGNCRPRLRHPDLVQGFEVRYLEYNAKYNDDAWGFEEDLILDDVTTRVHRKFVQTLLELEELLNDYGLSGADLRLLSAFDSPLLEEMDGLLSRPVRPHLRLPGECSPPPDRLTR